MLISFWSVCGLFQILPTIHSHSSDIQTQQELQRKWGKNVIRFECFLRLLLSVALFTNYWVMRNYKFEYEQKFIAYVILIAFALYPYAMELLFQTPLSLFCRGSFFLIHHIDSLTSLPNTYRFNKDIRKMTWKMGLIVTNIRNFGELNEKYGQKCGDLTLIKFMQRIVFEMEENASYKMKLYRMKDDRFLIVSSFPTEEEFKEFIRSLADIEITVLRPSDYNYDESKAQKKKNDDATEKDVENQREDDFINPNNANNGYANDDNGNGSNWYDSDDEEEENVAAANVDEVEDKNKTLKKSGTRKRKNSRKRKMSSFNKQTANEYMEMSLRIAGSFGSFCTLNHVMSLDRELQENDKKGYIERKEDRYEIVELKDFEK